VISFGMKNKVIRVQMDQRLVIEISGRCKCDKCIRRRAAALALALDNKFGCKGLFRGAK
jgi:hypothetical protein